ncbi:hypothetical protein SISSUDRAFT_1121761 [Sistotremastrum suecicum HHB10207 ss-3]|uniref:Peptidase C14 n=1 Tax=Sistotremastrum suecicum HHB10207 ss-3 TaxID=1314776 RepID=A0A166ADB4_9AGAM|nr:hypothetical protein SISSUDRAFT_1121761 [Sistotremastrum suecicum HHB10207 ss-3]
MPSSLQNTFQPFLYSLGLWFSSTRHWLGLQGDTELGIAVAVLTAVGLLVYILHSRRSRQTFWRLSKLRGTRKSANHKALIIGVARAGDLDLPVLDAPHSDAEKVSQFLLENGWDQDRIIKLVDTRNAPSYLRPTESNIKQYLRKMIENARVGDELFLYVATHGFQSFCMGGDEEDSKDEGIYSCDGGEIIDNTLFDIAIKPLPKGCKMIVLFDTCHSGTGMDLPYRTERRGSDEGSLPSQLPETLVKPNMRESNGKVVMWSSCFDDQQCWEIEVEDGEKTHRTGAFTHTFLQQYRSEAFQSNPSHRNLHGLIWNKFRNQTMSHRVQLSSSLPLNVDERFSI